VAPGQRTAKSGGRPGANGKDADTRITNVSLPGSQAGDCNRQPKRAERPHSKFSDCKALDGPAMRPATPLAVENGVGKLAANVRQMPAWERECGELPRKGLTAIVIFIRIGKLVGCTNQFGRRD